MPSEEETLHQQQQHKRKTRRSGGQRRQRPDQNEYEEEAEISNIPEKVIAQEEKEEQQQHNEENVDESTKSASSVASKSKKQQQQQQQLARNRQSRKQQIEEEEEEEEQQQQHNNNDNDDEFDDDDDDDHPRLPKPKQQHQNSNNNKNNKNNIGGNDENEEDKPRTFRIRRISAHTKTEKDYTKLQLNPLTVKALQEKFSFTTLTDIQAHSIPQALAGRDILAEAKTGSGKTLAFLIPIVEILTRSGFRPQSGTGAIIIGPTRELCQQIEGVLLKLTSCYNGTITFLCCIGGINRKNEGYKLSAGQQIVVSSPGRLLDHLKLTSGWHTKNLLILAVDEADRVLDNGFEEDIREIVSLLPKQRQTFLFSATQTTRVEQLARISLRGDPVFISLKSKDDKATVDTLEQGYVLCPSELRFLLLYKFIKNNLDKKVIVFFSSRNSVSFHYELLNYIDVPCIAFHGKQKQHQRSATFMQFCNAPSGILLTTDVAARGLDVPRVDWIVQFDPPDEPTKYIHRVGRTARANRVGQALMFLLPHEKKFLSYLREDANIPVSEFIFDLTKITEQQQKQFSELVMSNYYLRMSAKQAYEGYLLSYSASQLKNVFDVHQLDLAKVARGFGLSEPPPIRVDLSESAARLNKRERKSFKNNQQQQPHQQHNNNTNQQQQQQRQRPSSANSNNHGGKKQWSK